MLQICQISKNQLDNLVDFEKCCKTRIYLQKSVPIQPKTSNSLPKFCQPTGPTGPTAALRSATVLRRRSRSPGPPLPLHLRRGGRRAPARGEVSWKSSGKGGQRLGEVKGHAEKADQLGSMGHLRNCCASGIAAVSRL